MYYLRVDLQDAYMSVCAYSAVCLLPLKFENSPPFFSDSFSLQFADFYNHFVVVSLHFPSWLLV